MFQLKTFKDAAVVAQDAAGVAACFTDVPAGLVGVARDAYAAAVSRSAAAVQIVIDDAAALKAAVLADNAAAGPAFDRLDADLKTLLADLS